MKYFKKNKKKNLYKYFYKLHINPIVIIHIIMIIQSILCQLQYNINTSLYFFK